MDPQPPPPPPPPPPPYDGPPTQHTLIVPGVDLVDEIGRGGFAKVWRGRQVAVDREVAVKIDNRVVDDDTNRRRFVREATAVSRISGHPHVVSLIDVGVTNDNRPYLVMELCANGSLASYLDAHGPLRVDEAIEVGLAVTSALAAAHEAGILHRDLKPGNVLIDAWGTPRLSDFGLAALPQPGQDLSVSLEALTPAYASPEAFAAAPPTTQSDVFSMGATLHAMITGASPRRSTDGRPASVEEILAGLRSELPDPGLPDGAGLMHVIRTATAYDAADRYPTARQLHEALRAIRPGVGSGGLVVGGPEASFTQLRGAAAPAPASASRGTPRRRWPLAVAGAVAGLALGGVGGLLLAPDSGGSADPRPPAAAGSSDAPTPDADPLTGAPELGTCYSGVQQIGQALSASSGSCPEGPWEVFETGQLDDATTDVTTDAIDADPTVRSTCTGPHLRSYLDGKGERERGNFDVFVLPPSTTAYIQGQRWFACLYRPTG
ncbi:serine/threonine-protein kinase [Pimelobacter simplex]|uniref:serine/threonine-protein kinase n=1 Tax=Nocardioides simplex TaxID=2045 RepID=UPI0038180DBC